MKTKKKEIPVFYDQADESWHYHQKYLTTDLQIGYCASKEGYDTPEDAMHAYLNDSERFSEKMKALKDKQPGNIDFRQELINWYYNIHLAKISGSTVVRHAFATIMEGSSVNLKELAEIMGHHSSDFTMNTYVEKKQPIFEGTKGSLKVYPSH